MSSARPLLTVQALRAIAAAAVVGFHVLFLVAHRAGYGSGGDVISVGASGVDLFFVISGFIMVFTNADAFNLPNAPTSFLRRRFIRIVPLYWLCTGALVFFLAFTPQLFATAKFDWTHVLSSFFFLLSKNSAGEVGTVLQTGWTLCYEMYFYIVFALLLNWPRRYFLIASAAIFAAGMALGPVAGSLPVWASVATNPILLEFYFGAVIGFLFIRRVYLPPPSRSRASS